MFFTFKPKLHFILSLLYFFFQVGIFSYYFFPLYFEYFCDSLWYLNKLTNSFQGNFVLVRPAQIYPLK